jgi:DNA polymerase III epsilon subunit-like protein
MFLEKLDPFHNPSKLLTPENLSSICYFDTETTGLHPSSSQIVEIAAIKGTETFHRKIFLTPETKEQIQQQEQNPPRGKSIKDLLKMSDYESGNPTSSEREALRDFKNFTEGSSFLLAHNASFDMKMVNGRLSHYGESSLERIPVWDSLAFSRRFLLPSLITLERTHVSSEERKKAKDILDVLTTDYWQPSGQRKKMSSKLGDLASAMKGNISNWHQALADVQTLKSLVEEFFLIYQNNLSSVSSSPTFKKYYMRNRRQEERMKEWDRKKKR